MVNNEDIINFIAQTIEIGGLFKVSCDSDKFIMADDKPVMMKLSEDDKARPLAIYGTMNSDAYIVNPFNEGEASASISNWYYSSRNLTIGAIIVKIIIRVLEAGARAHGKNAKEEEGDALCAKYLGKYTSKIDDKMLKEFTSLSNSLQEFCSIFYNKSKRTCKLNCLIFKQSAKEHHSNVRKASWEVFEHIAKSILGCKNIDEFDYIPENPNIPVFESFINIYVELMKRLEKPAELVNIDLSNWKTIKEFLPYLDQYYQQAKWCTDSVNHTKGMYPEDSCTSNCSTCGNCMPVQDTTGDVLPPDFYQATQPAPVAPMPMPIANNNSGDVLPPDFYQANNAPVPAMMMQQPINTNGDKLPPDFYQPLGFGC